MPDPVLDRAADLLAAAEHRALPLHQLYDELVDDLGRRLGGAERLERRMARSPDRFALEPAPEPVWQDDRWPAATREAYRDALREAAAPAYPRVFLLPSSADPISQPADSWDEALSHSLAELLALSREAALLQASAGSAGAAPPVPPAPAPD